MDVDYPGFCAKYGVFKMTALALATPPALIAAFNAVSGYHQGVQAAIDPVLVFTGAGIGFALAATFTHIFTETALSKRGIGITRGGKILQQAQAATYGLTLLATLALVETVKLPKTDDPGTKPGAVQKPAASMPSLRAY